MFTITATIDVGVTTSRPVIPDEYVVRVIVPGTGCSLDAAENDATLTAIAMVMGARPAVQMPTSTTIKEIEL